MSYPSIRIDVTVVIVSRMNHTFPGVLGASAVELGLYFPASGISPSCFKRRS